jgi:cyclophilin family peptidyl-prolyl cis-trans isomerase
MTWKIWELFGSARKPSRRVRRSHQTALAALAPESLEPRALLTGNASGEVGGVAFIDVNGNGIRDRIDANRNGTLEESEQALELIAPGVTVELKQGETVVATTKTLANGTYKFVNVLPGNYSINLPAAANTSITGLPTIAGFTVVGGDELTQDLPLGGLRASAISLRLFQNTTVAADLPFATAGTEPGKANERENNLPELANGPFDVELAKNGTGGVIDLAGVFTDPDFANSEVVFKTSRGDIRVELFDADAPQTVANFFNYADDDPRTTTDAGRYDGSIFHRLSRNFVLQGGDQNFVLNAGVGSFEQIDADPAIQNEFGASNIRGTLAMARVGGQINSATNNFFFNIGNNTGLDNVDEGFTVFGRIKDDASLAVLDAINSDATIIPQLGAQDGYPVFDYDGNNFPADATLENFVTLNDVQIVSRPEFLTYELISNSNESLFTASIVNNRLFLTKVAGETGEALITVKVTDRFGASITETLTISVPNHEPTASVSISPLAPVPADTMTANVTGIGDADGDPVTLTYVWTKIAAADSSVETITRDPKLIGVGTTTDSDTLDLSEFPTPPQPGDIIRVTVTPNDGEDDGTPSQSTTVVNRPPVVELVELSSAAPNNVDTLTATAMTSDADGQTVTLSYVWKVNGVVVAGETTQNLDLSTIVGLTTGDEITVEVTPNDGKVDGLTVSASVTIANSAPVISSVTLNPNPPTSTDTLTATITVSDDDMDDLTLTYVWKVNGGVVQTTSGTTSTTDELALSSLVTLSDGDVITVEVTAHDGKIASQTVTASTMIDNP